jgi:hypothetical protein
VRWTRAEIVLEPFARTSAALSAADLVTALEDGVREWNDALDDCGAPRLRVARAPSSVGRIRQDERSVVLVRTGTWCSDGARDRGDCYDDGRAAITRLYPVQSATSQRDGEIREADIELNAVDYRWSLDGDAAGTRSLRAIIAHELGHVLGLEHSCSASPKSRAAGKSIPLPSCSASEARASIMFPEPVESERRLVFAPGHSETATLCALYPRANSPWF